MLREANFLIGRIIKVHGVKGALKIKLEAAFSDQDLKKLESVFIEINGDKQAVPFFIQEIEQIDPSTIIITLEDIDSPEKAQMLKGKNVFLPHELLPETAGAESMEESLKDFLVVDAHYGEVGRVEGVEKYPQHDVLEVRKGEDIILIPMNEEIIKKIDKAQQRIEVETPEGLIDLYITK